MKIKAETTLRVNFVGTLNMCNEFFKLLRPHARVVNVSSRAGLLTRITDAAIVEKLASETTTTEEIVNIANQFVE